MTVTQDLVLDGFAIYHGDERNLFPQVDQLQSFTRDDMMSFFESLLFKVLSRSVKHHCSCIETRIGSTYFQRLVDGARILSELRHSIS